ncbi:GNAT family N-acetyltransferase [Haloimpatiens lingqiaonensis]|uniref:GNAT family N-acetyltransferase n=1 Tax=Haloimpatiens lingqiaonensis TaxID=1380675 RepID=UPI0010FD6081|nr:GNAT family protein [Haloimpatiens lingqiaonensis]
MLKGKKVILKSMEKKEVPTIYNILCDREVREFDGAYLILPGKDYIIENFNELTSGSTKYLTIVNEKGLVIGYMTYRECKDSINVYSIGITIGKNFWSKGYGQDSVNTLLNYLFLDRGAMRVELEVVDLNEKAINCYKKCGFQEEGRKRNRYFIHGKYTNVVIMGILKEDFKE